MQIAVIIGIVLLWAISLFHLLFLFRYPGWRNSTGVAAARGLDKLRILSKVSTSLWLTLMYYYVMEGKTVPFLVQIISLNAYLGVCPTESFRVLPE